MTAKSGALPMPDLSMISVAARMALEQAVARVIRMDVVVARNLTALEGRILQVSSTAPSVDIYVRLSEQPEFLANCEQSPDCVLSGSGMSLLRLALSEDPLTHLQQSNITLEGNSDLLLAAATIVREADFDWEGQLAQYTGGVFAHMFGSFVRKGHAQVRHVVSTLIMDLPEFIQEELRILPPLGEVDGFMEDLDQLRLTTDRLQARIERLNRLKTTDNTGRG